MEYANGTWNIIGPDSLLGEFPGVSLTQYDALMQRLTQIQASFERFAEREVERTNEYAAFIAETKLRLTMVESGVSTCAESIKEQIEVQTRFRSCIEKSLADIRQQVGEIDQKADKFPNEIRSQWKGISLFLSGGVIVLAALWSFVQGLWWIYEHVFPKVGQ